MRCNICDRPCNIIVVRGFSTQPMFTYTCPWCYEQAIERVEEAINQPLEET